MGEPGWNALLSRLDQARYRGSIVGPHGSGKTTLLEDLAHRLERRGWRVTLLRLDTDHRSLHRLANWTSAEIVLCDGAEQLSIADRLRLRWLARNAGGLIVTRHDQRWTPVLFQCRTTPPLLLDLITSLGATMSLSEAEELHERHAGDIRTALRELYDLRAFESSECGVSRLQLRAVE